MLVLLVVVDNRVDDVFLVGQRSCDEAGRQFNGEIRTVAVLIFPSRDVADNFLDVIVAKLVNDRCCRVRCNFICPVRPGDFGLVLVAFRNAPRERFCLTGLSRYIWDFSFFLCCSTGVFIYRRCLTT